MLTNLLLPVVPGLEFEALSTDEESITLQMTMTQVTAPCPLCRQRSRRIHSRYTRTLADLPWSGRRLQVRCRIRRFFCDNAECRRRIFAERLDPAIAPYARRTRRLDALLESHGLALGGKGGAPLARRSGMPVSASTLLRILRRAPEPVVMTPRVLGVDDWAKRKRHTDGTLLVDLEQHRPIDVLPDRKPESLAVWLRDHPGVEIITRDRFGDYAQGATCLSRDPALEKWLLN